MFLLKIGVHIFQKNLMVNSIITLILLSLHLFTTNSVNLEWKLNSAPFLHIISTRDLLITYNMKENILQSHNLKTGSKLWQLLHYQNQTPLYHPATNDLIIFNHTHFVIIDVLTTSFKWEKKS